MFNGVLTTVLNSTLGKFLQIDEIKVGFSGIVELRNVELNAKTIETFLPVSLKLGRIGLLRIELGILSPTKVQISDVYCVAGLPKDSDVNEAEITEQLLKQKIETLLNWELLNFPEKQVESEKGKLMQAVDTLIDHVTVSVERIHVVFEERGVNAGVTVGSVQVFPIDEKEEQITHNSDTTVVSRRKIQVSGVGIYLNIDPDEAARGAAIHQLERDEKQGNIKALTDGLYGTSTGARSLDEYNRRRRAQDPQLALIDQVNSFKPENSKLGFPQVSYEYCQSIWSNMEDPKWSWILSPLKTTVFFNMWKAPLTKLQAMEPPKASMEGIVDIGRVDLALNHDQYQAALTLMAQFLNNPATLAMIKLQTQRDTSELSKKDQSLIEEAEKNELIADGMEYSQLYKLNFQGYPIQTDDQTKRLSELETKHPLTQILTWRAISLKIVQIEYEQEDKPFWRQKPSSGFFGSWFGGGSAGAPKPTTTIEQSLLRAFIEDPAALQHEEEKKTMQNVQANYTKMFFAAQIKAVAFSLVQPSRDKILEFGVYDIGAEVRIRPQGMGITAGIDKLEAFDHLTQNALSRTFITKSKSLNNEKFLSASISMGDKHINPQDGFDMVLTTKITGVDVLVNLPLLLSLGAFFAPPKHAAIASKSKNEIMNGFSQLKNTNPLSVFEARGRQKMDVQISSPTIIIPTSVTDPKAHVLVCRLGTLEIKAEPPTLTEVKEQKVLMEKASRDISVLNHLDHDLQKQLFYDTFNISLYGVSVSIGDPALIHAPNDSVYLVRPMELNLIFSMCLLQPASPSAISTTPSPTSPKSSKPALSLRDLTLPSMLIDLSLPSIDVQISPLKISRLLRLTKALLSALKLSQGASETSSSQLKAEETVDSQFRQNSTALVEQSTTVVEPAPVNPHVTSMLVSVQLGRVSLVIVNDLVPLFPVNILFLSMEGMYCAVAMRAFDIDVSMVLKSFYLQDCLNNYGGPNRFIVAGASRPLLSFNLNPDNTRMMNHMLTHAFPYQDELPQQYQSKPRGNAASAAAKLQAAVHHATKSGQVGANIATADTNSLQASLTSKTSVVDSAFLSCHVSLPQHASPYYAFVSTLATAHFGQIVININRESIPALACFFAKQLLPNPSIFTPEDKIFGQIGLDFMQDVEWGDLDEDLQNLPSDHDVQLAIDQNNNINKSSPSQQFNGASPIASPEHQTTPPVNIDPNLGFDPNLLKSGLEIAADQAAAAAAASNQTGSALGISTPSPQQQTLFGNFDNYNHTGFDMERVMPLVHAPTLTVPSRPQIVMGRNKVNLNALPAETDDAIKLVSMVNEFLDTLIEIDEHDYNLHFFGLTPGVSAAYPSSMATKPAFLELMALYDQDESELPVADGEDRLMVRQQFRNKQVKLRNELLRTELASLSTTISKLQLHFDFIKKTPNTQFRPTSPINCTSSQLLALHRYVNTKVLLQLSRLQERERVLKNRSGAYEEKVEIQSRIKHYEALLHYRRVQLLSVRNYERQIRQLRRLGCISSLLCTDQPQPLKSASKLFKTQPSVLSTAQHRVGVFCMPKSLQSDTLSLSLENVIENNNLSLNLANIDQNYDLSKDPLYDPATSDAVCPLILASSVKFDDNFEKKFSLVPLDVLARVTFGGVIFTLTTQNVPILQSNITPFTMGFGMHPHGMSIKLLIGTLSLRQPTGALPNMTANRKTIPTQENDFTNITRGFLNQTVQHQLTRYKAQQVQKKDSKSDEFNQLSTVITTQLVNLKQYIEDNYHQRTGPQGSFYASGTNSNSALRQKYNRFVENRRNYRLDYPDIVYTAPPIINGENTHPHLGQVIAESDNDETFYMLNLSVEMHAQEMIIFDDTDEYDYYSLLPIHHMTGFDDLAAGLQGIGQPEDLFHSSAGPGQSHRTAFGGSQHSNYNLRGKKVSTSNKSGLAGMPGLGRGSSLLMALNSRHHQNPSFTNHLSTLTAVQKATSANKEHTEVVNTAVVTELPFNVPAFIMAQNSLIDQFDLGTARIVPTMTIKGTFRGIRMVVCYKSVDNLLRYIEGLDKCMEAVMSNNSYSNTMSMSRNRIRSSGDSLRSASLLSHLSDVESKMSQGSNYHDDFEQHGFSRHGSSATGAHTSGSTAADHQTEPHNARESQGFLILGGDQSQPLVEERKVDSHAVTRKAHIGAGPSDDFKTGVGIRSQQQEKPSPATDTAVEKKVQKKLHEIGQAVNNLNNSTDPEAPRACPLLMDIDLIISDLAISIPISSTSFELVSITLDQLSIRSSTSLTYDTSAATPAEGATFYASSNESNTAQNATGRGVLSQLIKQQHQFQRQTSLSKQQAATGSPQPGSLIRRNSLLGSREPSMSLNSESVFQRLRLGSLLQDDDDEFFDAEELDESNDLVQVLDDDFTFFEKPQTYMSVPNIPTDTSVFYQIAQHAENAKEDKIHTLGKPTQTYDYRNLQIDFCVALTGITITTLVLADGHGVREQSAAPRLSSVLDLVPTTDLSDSQLSISSPNTAAGTDQIEKPRLQMLDLMCIGDIVIHATHFTYIPFIIITPPESNSSQHPETTAAMGHTAHTFYPRMPLPDWAVAMNLDNVDLMISQPQLSLLLSLISTHSVFPGNIGEKSVLTFPPYQPATPSNATTATSLAQIQFYHPAAAVLTLQQLKTALHILAKSSAQDSFSSEQAKVVLEALQKSSVSAKFTPIGTGGPASAASRRDNLSQLNSGDAKASRLSRIGTHMAASRMSFGSKISFVDDDVDLWAVNDFQTAVKSTDAPKKGLGVSVSVDIGRFSLQVVGNPALSVARSLCILVSTKTRMNMLPDGTISISATVDDLTVVNAELPTNSPSTLRDSIFALATEHAILKPMSCVTTVSITPNSFNHKELLAPLPKLYTPATATKSKTRGGKQMTINTMAQPTHQPGQISSQVISVSCIVTDMNMKVSYSDYDMLMSVLGTLSASTPDDFASENPTAPTASSVVDKQYEQEQLGLTESSTPAATTAHAAEPTTTPAPVVTYTDQLLHSMGDMTVSFSLPTLSILLVNDSPGFPLPFMRIAVCDVGMDMVGFAHRRNILLRSAVEIDFHNGALVAWEPLLEPSKYEILVVQSVTHPMQINITSLGKINLNVTRAMMEGLAQSLALLASAQAAQQKQLQNRLQQLNGIDITVQDDGDDDGFGDDDFGDNNEDSNNQTPMSAQQPDLFLRSNVGSSVSDPVRRRYNQQKRKISSGGDTSLVDNLVHRRESEKLKNFSFFRLDNHTEFQLHYQFGAQVAHSGAEIGDNNELLVDIKDVEAEVLDNILDTSNHYYDAVDVLNKTALDLYTRIYRIHHGGFLAGSPHFAQYTADYDERISQQRLNSPLKTSQIQTDLTKAQCRRLFRFNLLYTAWSAYYGNIDTLKSLFKNSRNSAGVIERIEQTSHSSLASLSSTPLFFGKTRSVAEKVRKKLRDEAAGHEHSESQTIGDLLSQQHRQALQMITTSNSKISLFDRFQKGTGSTVAGALGLNKQSAIAAGKLLSLQIAGYEPIHNIQIETVGSQSYMLTPGRQCGSTTKSDLEPLSVLIHVTVVQGIKVVSIRNSKAMVNLTDSVLEMCYGVGLASKSIIFPGDTFYLPLSTQISKKVINDDGDDEEEQSPKRSGGDRFASLDTLKTSASFVSIRPITLVPNGRSGKSLYTTSTRSNSRQMLSTIKSNNISAQNSYSSFRYSYPTNLENLINGSYLVSEAQLDDAGDNYAQFFPGTNKRDISQQSNKNADFIAVVQRWRTNGLTYWALCPPFSITNLLSERAVISLSTQSSQDPDAMKEQKKMKKKDAKIQQNSTIDFGSTIVANIAPTHSLRCYNSVPTSTQQSAQWTKQRLQKQFERLKLNDSDRQTLSAQESSTIDWNQFSAKPDPQQGLYMSLSIPALGLTTKTPQLISQTGKSTNYHLYFDLVNQKAYEHSKEHRRFMGSDLRSLVVHCEVSQSSFLINHKTQSSLNIPNVVTAPQAFLQSWQAQVESPLLSYSTNELEHIAAASLHLLPSAIAAGVKMVLYTPYWLFDTTSLGLLVSEDRRLHDLKQLTPTQYDSPVNAMINSENQRDMFTKLRTWSAVSDKSAQANVLEETGKLIAIGTKLSSHLQENAGCLSSNATANNGLEMPRETLVACPTTGRISSLVPQQQQHPGPELDGSADLPGLLSPTTGEQGIGAINQDTTRKLDERCYVKAIMFSSHQHSQIPSLRVVARLASPAKIIATPDNQHPPQRNQDLQRQHALTFTSESCDQFSLDAVGITQNLEFKGVDYHRFMLDAEKKDKILYCVTVMIRNGQDLFKRTKQVFFSPQVVIINKLPLPVLIRQHCLDDLASLKNQTSQITTRFAALNENLMPDGVRDKNVSLNLLESTPDNLAVKHDHELDIIKMNSDNPLYLEGRYHAEATMVQNTEKFLPTDQTETFHWPHANQEKLLSFKLLTQDDPFTHFIEEEAVNVTAQSLKKLRSDLAPGTNNSSLVRSGTADLTPANVNGHPPSSGAEPRSGSSLLENLDIRTIACPLPNANTYTLQSDGHNVISAVPRTGDIPPDELPTTSRGKARGLRQTTPWDEGIWGWSGYFNPTQVGDQTIIVRNPVTGKSLIVKIRVILTAPDIRNAAGNTMTVVFEAQDLVFPKYRIENNTCSDTLRIAQAGSQEWLTLRPYDTTVYTWDQPLINGILQLDVISGATTVHKEFALDEIGSKGTITVPGEASNALNLLVAPQSQQEFDEHGKVIKPTAKQKKSGMAGELTLYNQKGGVNPITANQSKRSTHTVFAFVRAEGPTRVLVISDFPAANQDVDLLTSQLLSTPEVKTSVQGLYDQCRIGLRGADVGKLLQKWNNSKEINAITARTGEEGQGALGLTEKEIPGPHGLRLMDETLAARARAYESEDYLDDFCSQITVLQRNQHQSQYQATVHANLAAQQFGYEEFNSRDQLYSQIQKLSQSYPGFDIWDQSLSEEDILMLSTEKGRGQEGGKQDRAVKCGSSGDNSGGEISSVAATGADTLPLTATELVDLVKVRAQTIKSIVIKHNNVQYQTSVVGALAKWQVLQTHPELDGNAAAKRTQSPPQSPTATQSALFATPENPTGQSPKQQELAKQANTTTGAGRNVPPSDKMVTISQDELSLISNLKDDVSYLIIRVNEARWLTPASLTGLSDCYAMITFNNQSYKTHVAVDTTNPFWSSEMFFKLDGILLRDLRLMQADYLRQLQEHPDMNEVQLESSAFNTLSLRVAIFHHNTLLSDTFLGGIILSSLDNIVVSQLHHETVHMQQKVRNLASNFDPKANISSSDTDPSSVPTSNCPVLYLNRWFKLHAIRQNKLLYGQCHLSFGFVSNELIKQQLLLYQLEQDLLEHILLLTRITWKYRQQLQSIDVGVIDLNTLYLQPQLSVPIDTNFIHAVRAKDLIKKQQRVLKKIKFKEKTPKGGFATKVTMTKIGPIRYPIIDFPRLHKRRPDLFRNVNLYPRVDPNAPQTTQITNPRNSDPAYPNFVPIPLLAEQTTNILTELSEAAVREYNKRIEDQQEISVCVSLEDVAVDLKHIYACLLKEDKLLPHWIPTKIVALMQCNGHISKLDLFDFILPEMNQLKQVSNQHGPEISSRLQSSTTTTTTTTTATATTTTATTISSTTISSTPNTTGPNSPAQSADPNVPPSTGLGAALQQQERQSPTGGVLISHLSDDDYDDDAVCIEDMDYATLLALETDQWVERYGLSLRPHLGPNQGDITVLPQIMGQDGEDDETGQDPSSQLRESSVSSNDLRSSSDDFRSSHLGQLSTSLNRNVSLTLNKANGKHELLTFTLPLSLIKSYVDPLNDVYRNIDTGHINARDIPALTMTLLCEVQQNKTVVSNAPTSVVITPPNQASPSQISPSNTSSTTTTTTSPTNHISPTSQDKTTQYGAQKGNNDGPISILDSIGFSTPLKASVHLADIDVPLVDLQYVDIYNPGNSVITKWDADTGLPYEVDGLGRRCQNLVLESHYYFARRAQYYRTTADLALISGGNNVPPIKLLDRFTKRIQKPPTPIANLTEAEIRDANNVYQTKNPHVMAAYTYHDHLQHQLSNYMQVDEEHMFLTRLKERQIILEQRASAPKAAATSSPQSPVDNLDIEEFFWNAAAPVSATVSAENQIYGIDANVYPLLKRVPLSPVRACIKAHLQSSKPLIEHPQMSVYLDIPHFGLSLVDSTLGKAEELLYISARGVVIDMEDSITQRAIEFKVGNFQIDQCIEFGDSAAGAQKESVQDSSKIIFGPSENALASGQPFVHISLNQTKTHPNYPVQVFKYATILVQEMSIRVEEALIWHLLRFSNDILPALSSSVSSVDTSSALSYLVCDQRILYQPLNTQSTALFYFSVLHIQPISMFLTFKINPDVRSSADDMTFNPIQTVLSAATGILGSIDAAPICMASLLISDAAGDITTLISPIVQFYVSQGIREGYKVLGSVEFLGNPVSLVSGVGSGVKDFFYEPAQGLVSSPKDFGTGLVKGSASLVRSLTTGLFGAASKVTGSVGKGLSTLTMDSSFQSSRRARNNKKIKHAGEGLLQGTKALSYGLFSGLSGIVMNPLEGARSGGATGFMIGIATGLTGVVTKTASGAMDLISLSLQGLSNTFKLFDDDVEPVRARFPRFISSYGSMRNYSVTFALGRFVLDVVASPKLDGVAKQVFSAITGLGDKHVNAQRENDFTISKILDLIDNSAFYDIDLASTSLTTANLTSVLVEIESLLASTIYGATFNPNTTHNKDHKQFTNKELERLKHVHNVINDRLKFLSTFASEDLITCLVVNTADTAQNNTHAKQQSTIDGLSLHATLIVLTTKRLIAVQIKDVLQCAKEGGALTGRGVKCNILLDRLVDLTLALSEELPDPFTNKPRQRSQLANSTKILEPKQRTGLLKVAGLIPLVGGDKDNAETAIMNQKALLKQQQAKAQRAVNYLIITHSAGNDESQSVLTVKLPIINTLDSQATLLSLQSYLLRPRVLIAKYGDNDITPQFASQFFNIPATPYSLSATNNSSVEFLEAIHLGNPRHASVTHQSLYPFSIPTLRPLLQSNQCYYPTPAQIQAVLKQYHMNAPKKVVTTHVRFDEYNMNKIHTTIRSFNPVHHGAIPLDFDYNGYHNMRKQLLLKGPEHQLPSSSASAFGAYNFSFINTQALLASVDPSSPTTILVQDDQDRDVQIVDVPTVLPLHSYPTTTLRTSPFALALRKPSTISIQDWNRRLLNIKQQQKQQGPNVDQYRSKILSVTFTVGAHVMTRQFTIFDESIVLL